jgi:hypothetical protein
MVFKGEGKFCFSVKAVVDNPAGNAYFFASLSLAVVCKIVAYKVIKGSAKIANYYYCDRIEGCP